MLCADFGDRAQAPRPERARFADSSDLAIVALLGAAVGGGLRRALRVPADVKAKPAEAPARAAVRAFDPLRSAADRHQSRRAAGHLDPARRLDRLRPQGAAASRSHRGRDRRRRPRLSADRLAEAARGADRAAEHPPGPQGTRSDPLGRKGQRAHDPNAGGAMKTLGRARGICAPDRDAGARAQTVDLNALIPAGGASASGAHHPDGRAPDRAFGRARPAHHGDQLHPLHRRAVVSALGPRHAERARQSRSHQPVACS